MVSKDDTPADDSVKRKLNVASQQQLSSAQDEFREKQVEMKAEKLGLSYMNLKGISIYPDALALVRKEDAKKAQAAPFYTRKHIVHLGVLNLEDPQTKKLIENLKNNGMQVKIFLITQSSLDKVLQSYKDLPEVHRSSGKLGEVELAESQITDFKKQIKDLADFKEKLKEVSTTEIIDTLIAGGVQLGASDIHYEPEKERTRVRYRIDGVLQDVFFIPAKTYPHILSRLKLMSRMKLNVSNLPQDGKFAIKLGDKEIDVRSSVLPSAYGETVVLRLLGIGVVSVKLDDLGLRGQANEVIMAQLKKPNGMILTTGPTGSGKTTTLYSFVQEVNKPGVKIITIENPIEYHIDGISQSQVTDNDEYGFANGLKAIMRQDPDIILVGEIRDFDTAEIALQAALTGHLVFSTLHTNDSAGVIPRLINMGARPFTIAPALNAAIAQRLVRRLCKSCAEEYTPDKEERERIENKFYSEFSAPNPDDDIDPDSIATPAELAKASAKQKQPLSPIELPGFDKLTRANGCSKCNDTGYKGRIGIYEVFDMNPEVERMTMEAATISEIRQATIRGGMQTMAQDGIEKMIQGITTFEEVERVT